MENTKETQVVSKETGKTVKEQGKYWSSQASYLENTDTQGNLTGETTLDYKESKGFDRDDREMIVRTRTIDDHGKKSWETTLSVNFGEDGYRDVYWSLTDDSKKAEADHKQILDLIDLEEKYTYPGKNGKIEIEIYRCDFKNIIREIKPQGEYNYKANYCLGSQDEGLDYFYLDSQHGEGLTNNGQDVHLYVRFKRDYPSSSFGDDCYVHWDVEDDKHFFAGFDTEEKAKRCQKNILIALNKGYELDEIWKQRGCLEDENLLETLENIASNKEKTTMENTKKTNSFDESLIRFEAFAEMEQMTNVAKELNEKYPIGTDNYSVSFPVSENSEPHPAIKNVEKMSLQAANEFLVALETQIQGKRNEIKTQLEVNGEQNIEDDPRYKAWEVIFYTNFDVYDEKNNLIDSGCYNVGDPEDRQLAEENGEKYNLFSNLLQGNGAALQFFLDQEKKLEAEKADLLKEQENSIGDNVSDIDAMLKQNKEDLQENEKNKTDVKNQIRTFYELKKQYYGTEIPKELNMDIPESYIPVITKAVHIETWQQLEPDIATKYLKERAQMQEKAQKVKQEKPKAKTVTKQKAKKKGMER